ncbi:tetratricopeptide repeat protein [Chitinophaga lutea]|uniref:Tetratricopeptide repeat protein n=1 Tax=Chitinophaga lutea TaxID=2488634 RepID=A0A3N4PPC6_9BACT|nr:tetratricopeptide repeat protein [Chitinophaga lutea]RPE05610.1 tetratricopeptide repeat protein [Chitinophaga lutea]
MMPLFRILLLLLITGSLYAQEEKTLIIHMPEQRRPLTDTTFLALKDSGSRAMEQQHWLVAARCFREMGRICYHLGHYPQALDYHLQAGRLFQQEGETLLHADNLNDIGTLYYYNRQPAQARTMYNEAFDIYRRVRNPAGMAFTHGKIGHLYEKQQLYDSAYYYQRLALSQYQQINDRSGTAKIYENLGSIYEDLARYDSAAQYFRQALRLNREMGDSLACIEVLNNLGDVLRKTGRYAEGLEQSRAALALALRSNEQYQVSSAYRDIAKSHNGLGNHDSAYHYLELSRHHLLQIYSQENGRQVALLQTMYDIEKKNNEIGRLRNARNITLALVAVGLLLVVTAALVISRQRLKIRNAQLLNAQERRHYEIEKALMESEMEHKKLQEHTLKQELEVRSKELSTHTLHIIQKNQLLETLHARLEEMVREDRRDQKKQLKQLQHQINQNFNHDQHWDEFRGIFEQVHQSFFDKLKGYCENLTPGDLRLVALLRMNLNSGDIATLLGISPDSLRVVRYRLRKKLNLPQGESLSVFIQSL